MKKITKIEHIGVRPVYDITTGDSHEYVFANGVRTHNTAILYSADTAWIVGRQQNKDASGLLGYNFIINVEKSRFVKEKTKIPLTVLFNGGIDKFSGLLDIAQAGGFVVKPSMGWYGTKFDPKIRVREKDTHTDEFWNPILANQEFKDFVRAYYTIGYRSSIDGTFLADAKIDLSKDAEEAPAE
jgi:hypothetical protein